MKARRPVTETNSPDTSYLRSERARRMEQIRKLEWEFDRHPTTELVDTLRSKRVELTMIEDQIVTITEEVVVGRLLVKTQELAIETGGTEQTVGAQDASAVQSLLERTFDLAVS